MKRFGTAPLGEARWVVVDCETSGLDPGRDRLLSVGAVRVTGGRILLGEAFRAIVRQAAPSEHANIIVHGIGADAQLAGRRAADVLKELRDFVGAAVPVAFHAPFDAEILRREMSRCSLDAPARWLDLAPLAAALFPAHARACRNLDEWLGKFAIECPSRHDALGDAFASAQLFLLLLDEARRQGVTTVRKLAYLSQQSRWIM